VLSERLGLDDDALDALEHAGAIVSAHAEGTRP
jgi:hypothetical protein